MTTYSDQFGGFLIRFIVYIEAFKEPFQETPKNPARIIKAPRFWAAGAPATTSSCTNAIDPNIEPRKPTVQNPKP